MTDQIPQNPESPTSGLPADFNPSVSLALPPVSDPKREAFVQQLLAGEEVKAAYVNAGFRTPRGNAQRMLREPVVAERLAHELRRFTDMDDTLLQYRRHEHRRALEHIANYDRTALFEEKNRMLTIAGKKRKVRTIEAKPLAKLTREERDLIDSIEISDRGFVKILMPRRLEARAMLAKLDGLDKPTKIAPTDPSGEKPAQYIISERPLTESEWEEQRARTA